MKELKFFNKGFKEKRRVDYRIVAFKKAVAILEGARLKSINSCVRKLKDKVDVESNEQLLARLKKISTKVVKANAAVMLQQLMKFDFQNVPFLVR
jgi:ribosomal protein L30/L7E